MSVFVRGGIFKREIPKIYHNTCAISGMRTDALANISVVDACPIVPFSEGYNDTLINGIALCPNLHRTFDRGLISLSDDYRVLLKTNFVKNKLSALISLSLTGWKSRCHEIMTSTLLLKTCSSIEGNLGFRLNRTSLKTSQFDGRQLSYMRLCQSIASNLQGSR